MLICITGFISSTPAQEFPTPAHYPLIEGRWPSTSGQKFSFAILGDKTSGGEGKWPIFDRAVDALNLLKPDFVITVGDQIPGHMQARAKWDDEWAEYLEHARRIEAPLFLIPAITTCQCRVLPVSERGFRPYLLCL